MWRRPRTGCDGRQLGGDRARGPSVLRQYDPHRPLGSLFGPVGAWRRGPGPGGALILYGPFMENGRHNAESNAQFDESLRSRDPSWGIRDLNEVMAIAADHDLVFDTKTAMPANNFTVVFQRALSTR